MNIFTKFAKLDREEKIIAFLVMSVVYWITSPLIYTAYEALR